MSGITVSNAPFPPATTQIGDSENGTITNIACAGPCTCTLYSAAGVALKSIGSPVAFNMPVSIAFTGGPPYVVQQTASAIDFTF